MVLMAANITIMALDFIRIGPSALAEFESI